MQSREGAFGRLSGFGFFVGSRRGIDRPPFFARSRSLGPTSAGVSAEAFHRSKEQSNLDHVDFKWSNLIGLQANHGGENEN
jgi:hypothetical protein